MTNQPKIAMQQTIANLFRLLDESPPDSPQVFNPWRDVDPIHDLGPESPKIRRQQLAAYLGERRKSARFMLVGEALGYQGGHFSGLAMTSERILLGHRDDKKIHPDHVFRGVTPRRTSKPEFQKLGFNEPTATIAWSAMLELGLDPYEFVIWNTFAWHPWNAAKGPLSNRRPTDAEVSFGFGVLVTFLRIFPDAQVIAVGKVAAAQLAPLVNNLEEVRHPANGGATLFREGIKRIVGASGHSAPSPRQPTLL